MRYLFRFIILFIVYDLPVLSFGYSIPDSQTKKFVFIQNLGQWPQEILFKADIPGGYFALTKTGINYYFYNPLFSNHANTSDQKKSKFTANHKTLNVSFNTEFQKSQIKPNAKSIQKFNYFLGSNPENWKSNVPGFEEVTVENIYPNIDFRIYNLDQSLKYEYIVKPGGDPNTIAQTYWGFENVQIKNKNLELNTGFGLIKEFEPVVFQKKDRSTDYISSRYDLNGNSVKFKIDHYNKSENLIIDPELVFSTYSGSSSDNWSHSATYDSKGNLYAAGTVFGPNFKTTAGAFQQKSNDDFISFGLETDIVIIKYASDGNTILYSTFLGGNDSEVPHSMVVNSKDELIVFGTTSSKDFPVNAYDISFNGGIAINRGQITSNILYANGSDIFVSVLSEDGFKLKGSTYIGGSANDGLHDFRNLSIQNYGDEFRGEVNVDADDNIYVASITNSDNFPLLRTLAKKASTYDAVVFELKPYCQELIWSTYIGGNDYDAAYGIKVSNDGTVFVCGSTRSSNLNPNSDVVGKSFGGITDAFIAKFKNYELIKKTYLGTSEGDLGLFIDLDEENNVYLFGLTEGKYPISSGVFNNPKSGQFIHCLNSDLTKTVFSTTLGSGRDYGKIDIVPTAFLVNNCGNIYLSGWGGRVNYKNGYNPNSTTVGLPITKDTYQTTTTGSNYYFAILEAKAKSLLYATFFGSEAPPNPEDERGDHLDGGTCRFDKNGVIYHSACVCKSNGFVKFPLKNAASENHNNNNCNMGAFKFDLGVLEAKFDLGSNIGKNPAEICAPNKLSFENLSKGAIKYEWYVNKILISTVKEINYTFTDSGKYEIKLKVFNNLSCKNVDSTSRFIKVNYVEIDAGRDTSVCRGSKVNLFASGGKNYTWTPTTNLDNSNINNPIATINEDIVYTVQIASEKCILDKKVNIKIIQTKTDFIVSSNKEICKGESVNLQAQGEALKFIWTATNMVDSVKSTISVSPKSTTIYSVRAIYADGCEPLKNIEIKIDDKLKAKFSYDFEYFCDKKPELILSNESVNDIKEEWTLENLVSNTISELKTNLKNTNGEQKLSLNVYNQNGCSDSISQIINFPLDDGIIPNVITPNGDKKNDIFVIGIPNARIEIFSKSGKLIYQSSNYKNDWGKSIQNGQYYYLITTPDAKTCKGWIQVIN